MLIKQGKVCLEYFNLQLLDSVNVFSGFPGGSDGKESACNTQDLDLIPGSGRSLGEGNGNPLQCSCIFLPGESHSQTGLVGYRAWG